jgi:hypothetical protein
MNPSPKQERKMTLDELLTLKHHMPSPLIYCLCGSTRRAQVAFEAECLRLTLSGAIVLSIGANKNDQDLGITEEEALQLDVLHDAASSKT